MTEQWGHWRFVRRNLTLLLRKPFGSCAVEYEIDLEECRDPAEILDWIAQVSHKGWATRADIGDLVAALDYLLALQAGICSFGHAGRVDDVRQRIAEVSSFRSGQPTAVVGSL